MTPEIVSPFSGLAPTLAVDSSGYAFVVWHRRLVGGSTPPSGFGIIYCYRNPDTGEWSDEDNFYSEDIDLLSLSLGYLDRIHVAFSKGDSLLHLTFPWDNSDSTMVELVETADIFKAIDIEMVRYSSQTSSDELWIPTIVALANSSLAVYTKPSDTSAWTLLYSEEVSPNTQMDTEGDRAGNLHLVKSEDSWVYYAELNVYGSNRSSPPSVTWTPVRQYLGDDPVPKIHLRGAVPIVTWAAETTVQYDFPGSGSFTDTVMDIRVAMKTVGDGLGAWDVSPFRPTGVHSLYPEISVTSDGYLALTWLQGRFDVFRIAMDDTTARAVPGLSILRPLYGEIYSVMDGVPIEWSWEAPMVNPYLHHIVKGYDGYEWHTVLDTSTNSVKDSRLYWWYPDSVSDLCQVKVTASDSFGETVEVSSDVFSTWWLLSRTDSALSANSEKLVLGPSGKIKVAFLAETSRIDVDTSSDYGNTWGKQDSVVVGDYYTLLAPKIKATDAGDTLYFFFLRRKKFVGGDQLINWRYFYRRYFPGSVESAKSISLGVGITGGSADRIGDSLFFAWTKGDTLFFTGIHYGDTAFSDTMTIRRNASCTEPFLVGETTSRMNLFWVEGGTRLLYALILWPDSLESLDTLYESALSYPTAVLSGETLRVAWQKDSTKVMLKEKRLGEDWDTVAQVISTPPGYFVYHPFFSERGLIWAERKGDTSRVEFSVRTEGSWSDPVLLESIYRRRVSYPQLVFDHNGGSDTLFAIWQEEWANAQKIGYKDTVIDVGLLGGPQSLGPARTFPFRLYPALPNPARDKMRIRYSIPRKGKVTLRVYDVTGRCVKTLVNGKGKPGIFTLEWRGRDHHQRSLPSGVYFIHLTDEEKGKRKTAWEKVVLFRGG